MSIVGSKEIITEERPLTSDFSEIQVSGTITLNHTQSSESNITVQANENIIERVLTNINSNVLNVSLMQGSYENIEIEVNVSSSQLENVNTSGTSDIRLSLQELDTLTLNASRASHINMLSGRVGGVALSVSGSSRYRGFPLEVLRYTVSISGTSNVELLCSEKISGSISGVSKIIYKGNPNTEELKNSGMSTISKSD